MWIGSTDFLSLCILPTWSVLASARFVSFFCFGGDGVVGFLHAHTERRYDVMLFWIRVSRLAKDPLVWLKGWRLILFTYLQCFSKTKSCASLVET